MPLGSFRRMVFLFVLIVCWLASQPIRCQPYKTSASSMSALVETERAVKPISFSRDGLLITNHDHSYELKVHGYLQGDGRLFVNNMQDQHHDELLFRRVRPLVEGTLANRVDFRFMPDFGEGNAVLEEAYLEWKSMPFARLRVGKFKTPIGLEVLRSDRDLTFAERSLASDLVPLRDLGAQVEGTLLQEAITYEVGYFSGTVDGTNANFEWRGTSEAVARVFFTPFESANDSALRQLGVGIAASAGRNSGLLPDFKTVGQQTFFNYSSSAMADGQHKHVSPQAYYFCGPAGFLAEHIISGATAQLGTEHRYLSNNGWEFAASIVMTGEKNSYAGIQPRHAFEPTRGFQHLGAWEIAFRQSRVDFDAHAFPKFANPTASAREAIESAVGLNWYLNGHTKLMTDYEYTEFHMNTKGILRLPPERVAMTRVQLAF